MLEVTNIRNGAVLSHLDGVETAAALTVKIEGVADPQARVTVNGMPVSRRDRNFAGSAVLTAKINEIVVAADSHFGENRLTLTVMWDKQSFRRFGFFIDDNSFFWTELMKRRPKSLFDQFYLAQLKKIHALYGTKFSLNCFFRNDHDPERPTLRDFPTDYKGEFQANCDWLRLAFHSCSEFPDRPYQHVAAEVLARDYDLVQEQLVRIAGAESVIAPPVIHWGMTNPANLFVLRERGVNNLCGGFLCSRTSVEVAESVPVPDIGFFLERDAAEYICSNRPYYDKFSQIVYSKSICCCNYDDAARLKSAFAAATDPASERFRETLSLMTHEQYCYPEYVNFIPDHFERMEYACRLAAESGYRPVFIAEGVLGNPAWEK